MLTSQSRSDTSKLGLSKLLITDPTIHIDDEDDAAFEPLGHGGHHSSSQLGGDALFREIANV